MLSRLLVAIWLLVWAAALRVATTAAPVALAPPTIIDYLSADVQYSYFLRHLQRLGVVPAVRQMQNVTVFAPVNLAFADTEIAANDTAESVLRYFADQRFRVAYLDDRATLLDSLYVAKHSGSEERPFPLKVTPDPRLAAWRVNDYAEIVDWDAYAKHQHSFIQTIDRLLPARRSICDLLMDAAPESSDINGHSISFVKSLFQLVFAQFPVHKKTQPLTCDQFLANVSTVLLPTDNYIKNSLLDLQQRYYTAVFHGMRNPDLFPTKDGVREMLQDALALLLHLLLPDLVGGINGTTNVSHPDVWGNSHYRLSLANDSLVINGSVSSVAGSTSLTFTDGVLHLFDATDNPPNFLTALGIHAEDMIPRKALYAMHFSQLVKEMKFYKRQSFIDLTVTNQTIIVDASDRDDYFDDDYVARDVTEYMAQDVSTFSFSTRQQMLYKFLEGAIDMTKLVTPKAPIFHRLLDSNLCLKKRIGSCFKVKISGELRDGKILTLFNDKSSAGPPVIAHGDNIIYVTETDFAPPPLLKNALAELISDGVNKNPLNHISINKDSCLQTLKYLNKFDLLSLDDNRKGYTAFLPCGGAIWDGAKRDCNKNYMSWKELGLILNHLEKNPKVFKDILKGLFLQDLIYSDFGLEDSKRLSRSVKTLRGDYVNVSETFHSGEFNHLIKVNDTMFLIPLNSDVLFNQGVVHVTQHVLLPQDFRVSLRDLIHAALDSSADTNFLDLLERFPKLAKFLKLENTSKSEYSLLVPSTDLLKFMNITTNYERLWEFLELHLISNNDAQVLLDCMNVSKHRNLNSLNIIQTNRTNGIFQCRTNPQTSKTYLSLKRRTAAFGELLASAANEKHEVRIINYGCSRQDLSNSSCVFLLDKALDVTWFDPQDTFLHVHIGWISVGIGIVIGVILFGFCTTTVALCLSRMDRNRKPPQIYETNFQQREPTYMRVTSDEDFVFANNDHGYETDDDMARTDTDQLLPLKGRRKIRAYGSISPVGTPSAPRKIKKQGLMKTLDRDRNLPPLNI